MKLLDICLHNYRVAQATIDIENCYIYIGNLVVITTAKPYPQPKTNRWLKKLTLTKQKLASPLVLIYCAEVYLRVTFFPPLDFRSKEIMEMCSSPVTVLTGRGVYFLESSKAELHNRFTVVTLVSLYFQNASINNKSAEGDSKRIFPKFWPYNVTWVAGALRLPYLGIDELVPTRHVGADVICTWNLKEATRSSCSSFIKISQNRKHPSFFCGKDIGNKIITN